jgi:epoxyqueuosine reductase
MDDDAFREATPKSAIKRTKRVGLVRSAATAAGNSGDHSLVGPLGSLLAEEADASIRRHAAWALGRLGGAGARVALEKQSADPDAAVREEVAAALEGLD